VPPEVPRSNTSTFTDIQKIFAKIFVDNVPVAENWMLGMCDVADCINDGRDPETIWFLEFQNSKT
jgi:hypothetical protein